MGMGFDELKSRDAQVLCSTYGRYPLAVSRARGSRLYDLDGREYVDLLAGLAVCNLGHAHPELAEVMAKQAQTLVHTSNLFYTREQVLLAEALLETCHADKAFFCNSGAEANEAAIKLTRRYMRKVLQRDAYEIVTFQGSFHGRTMGALAATGQERLHDGFEPLLPGFVYAPWNDPEGLASCITENTAAIMVEMVQGEGGIRVMAPGVAQAIANLCKERELLLIVDEVQTGFCRTGTFWCHQQYGLEPDIITTAKGLCNGLPMGAMLATDTAAQGFAPGSHATTFGGGPVLAAVALKVVEIMLQNKLAARAAELGAWALQRFAAIRERFPEAVVDVRGKGLMLGIELSFPAKDVWTRLLDKGFVCNCTQERVLRLLPALTIDKKDLENFALTLEEILTQQGAFTQE